MSTSDSPAQTVRPVKTRRLSKVRVIIAALVIAAIALASVAWGRAVIVEVTAAPVEPWFGGYVDVTVTPGVDFESPTDDTSHNVVLSFVVADPERACTPSWGAAYTLDEAASAIDLDRRIARLRQLGGEAVVSFGGAANDELATVCADPERLTAAYAAVVKRYEVSTIDIDIEGGALTAESAQRRADAIAALQADQRAAGKDLAVWLTLPVTTGGLSSEGTDAVAAFLAADVDIAGVNAMTMDFGSTMKAGLSMFDASTAALTATQRQLRILYLNDNTPLTGTTLWSKIGATPMIGQNDDDGQVFTLEDARALNAWALDTGISRISMWSVNRDETCGANYVNVGRVSNTCSGVDQKDTSFARLLGSELTGAPAASAGIITTPEALPEVTEDDPATSPYPIWSSTASYLAGTKIVWHHNVFEAKWWTRGDAPDDPVLDESATPWTLIGPVLPGETPAPVVTLPADTYPEWDGTAIYTAGDRVVFDGNGFEAKWWNQGDSPAATIADVDSSPWAVLTEAQILDVLSGATASPTPSG